MGRSKKPPLRASLEVLASYSCPALKSRQAAEPTAVKQAAVTVVAVAGEWSVGVGATGIAGLLASARSQIQAMAPVESRKSPRVLKIRNE